MRIVPAWLGYYWNHDDDRFDVFAEGIHLWISDTNVPRFEYMYEARSNHGYDLAHEEGVVTSVSADAITVVLSFGSSSSWEDMFKEHRDETAPTPQQRVIAIERVEDARPVLGYRGHVFKLSSADSPRAAEKFDRSRERTGRAADRG
jgi:hypothetical protein